jgi:hypothetical protein
MREQPLGKIMLVCMLLKNAHACLNGCQTSQYFSFQPPSFEEWVSQGPLARPISRDCPLSPDYEADEDSDDASSVEGDDDEDD